MDRPTVDLPESLKEQLRAKREQHAPREETFKIPGYGGQLRARFLRLKYRPARSIVESCETIPDPATRDLEAAARCLVAACQGVEAHVDGQVQDLGMKLGKPLADWLGFEGAETDTQAIFLIIPEEMDVIDLGKRVREMAAETDEDELLKNSRAAS